MFRRNSTVPPPVSRVTRTEWTVYTFRKRRFKQLTGIDADRHGIAAVNVTGYGPGASIEIQMFGDSLRKGNAKSYDAKIYTLGMAEFKRRLGIDDPRDVLLVSTGGALSSTIEVTMERDRPS